MRRYEAVATMSGFEASFTAGAVGGILYLIGVTLYSLHTRLRAVERELEERRGA